MSSRAGALYKRGNRTNHSTVGVKERRLFCMHARVYLTGSDLLDNSAQCQWWDNL